MRPGRDPGAAIRLNLDFRFREGRAQHHRVADDADVGAVAVDDDLSMSSTALLWAISSSRIPPAAYSCRRSALLTMWQTSGSVPSSAFSNSGAKFQPSSMQCSQAGVPPAWQGSCRVGVPRQEQPVPGPGMGLNGLGQAGHVGLCLGFASAPVIKSFCTSTTISRIIATAPVFIVCYSLLQHIPQTVRGVKRVSLAAGVRMWYNGRKSSGGPMTPLETLKRYLRLRLLPPGQEEIVSALLAGGTRWLSCRPARENRCAIRSLPCCCRADARHPPLIR